MDEALVPTLGNLAWAPDAAVERVEILDRFNGVPTLGILKFPKSDHLFWRPLGHVPDRFSVWIYVPLGFYDLRRLDECDGPDLLDGLVFGSRQRYVTVGISDGNRLFFEREWQLPAKASRGEVFPELARFLAEALRMASEQDLPPSRRERVDGASRVVEELAADG